MSDQTRNPARDYSPEPATVAKTLQAIRADTATLNAALAICRTGSDVSEQETSPQTAVWVDRVRRIEALPCPRETLNEPRQLELWRRLLLALANDLRPLLIVLARRLASLRLAVSNPDQASRLMARETLAIHAPLASRLGVHRLKWELEDLSFRCLDPETYHQLAKRLAATRDARESYVTDFSARIQSALNQADIHAKIQGRPKHLYSIWKKMQRKQVDLQGLFDLNAVRVLVDDIPSCYRVLALTHDLWESIPEEYDDYIARPKANGYQSLHTVVKGPGGLTVEIQIRTEAMHTLAEYGMAAHWCYKEGNRDDPVLARTLQALRHSLQTGAEDGDWFADQIFTLTPRQQVIRLPKGATPVDFAYAIHTEVGHHCRGAIVDGRIVPLDYPLQTGQRVEILTSKRCVPNRGWLDKVRSDHARQRIRQWFKQREAATHRRLGRQRLDREIRRLGLKTVAWPLLLRRFRLHQPEDLWLALGRGEISSGQLLSALREITTPSQRLGPSRTPTISEPRRGGDLLALQVHGERNLLTHLARCCNPNPNDEVIGYLTIHHRITIHKIDCPNILNLTGQRRNRLVEVTWG